MPAKNQPFPLPSELPSAPGAGGWEQLYPYFTRFQPEDDKRFWFYNSMHFPEPMSAFDSLGPEFPYTALGAFTTRVFAFPTTLGIDYRIHNGRVYITANPVTDEKEVAKRAAIFQERAGYYYANWKKLFDAWVERMKALIREVDAIEVPSLPEFEDKEVVMTSKGVARNHFLLVGFHRLIEAYSKMWHHHFEFLMLGYGAYAVFFQFCKKAFPEIPDQTIARMVSGIDVLMFRPDDEIKGLSELAVTLKVDDEITEGRSAQEVLDAMARRGAPGKEWLDALEKAREPWFNVTLGDGFYHFDRSWNDDLSIPFSAMHRYMDQVRKGKSLRRPTEKLREERARITEEYRALLSGDEERAAFDQMLDLCHVVFPFVEDHKFYCDHWFITRFYNKVREFGALLVDQDVIVEVEDVFHLQHVEVSQALIDVMIAWAAGSRPVGRNYWKPVIEKRKQIMKALRAWNAPPALGPMPESIDDPALQMLWGITRDTLENWARPPAGTDDAELRGFAASPGCVEGIARVLNSASEINQLKEGEILVCPITSPSWGPVFNKIKAAVSDIGGTMSHAAIVAREYGMPAVVGTGQATKRIRSGQRIRVDGNQGVVTIL